LWTRLALRWLLDCLLPLRRLLVPNLWASCPRLRLLLNPPWLLLCPCLRSALDPLYRRLLSGLSAWSHLLLHYDPWLSLRSRRLLSRHLPLRRQLLAYLFPLCTLCIHLLSPRLLL
jgi:hypothetical protein